MKPKFAKRFEIECKPTGELVESIKIERSCDAYDFIMKNLYKSDVNIYESAHIILMNNKNVVIGYAKIGQGAINQTLVDTRIIAKYCLDTLACSMIFVHNHPSGDFFPSKEDDALTISLAEIGKLINVRLIDHIIVTNDNYYSYQSKGRL